MTANTSGIADADGIFIINDGVYDIDPYIYQWQLSSDNSSWADITDATEKTYTLTSSDVGKYVRVQSTFTDNHGTSEVVTSSATSSIKNVNNNPTGSVVISGTTTEDATISIDTSALADGDGLGTLRYQWQRSFDDTSYSDIANATLSTYALDDPDVGNSVRVAISYLDQQGTQERVYSNTLTSITAVNDDPVGSITVSGALSQGRSISANVNNLSDADGLGTLKYQWMRSSDNSTFTSISAATEPNYELTHRDVDQYIKVKISYKDEQGFRESILSTATQKIQNVNDAPTGDLTLTGNATEDKSLTINTSDIADVDGLGSFSYGWQYSEDGSVWADRESTLTNSLTLEDADVGLYIRGVAQYTDALGHFETVYSSNAGPVTAVNDQSTGDLGLSGFRSSGSTLTIDDSSIADVDGLGSNSYSWYRGDTATGSVDLNFFSNKCHLHPSKCRCFKIY